MANPTDLVTDYINARISPVPKTPYTQEQSERYSAEADDGNEYSRKKREYEEPVPTREEYEANYREAESEYNSQQELDNLEDDLDQSEPDYDENHLEEEDAEFSGNYFEKPDESEASLGDRIRAKYDSFKASASDTAENLSSTFGASFGAAAGAANAKYSRFKRGDPIFSVQSPVRRGKNPYTRSISRPGRSISRPYSGGRFGDSFSLGTNGNTNPYYPVVNEGRQSLNNAQTMDMYLPSGAVYEGEFSNFNARNEFANSKYANNKEDTYDPFGFGGLSGDGFNNTGSFGSSLMGFGGDNGIFGGSAGQDNVFGNFGGGKTGKMDILGDSGMFAIGDLVSPPASRKTTTKRKSASTRKTAKKATKKPSTKRKASARKQTYTGFTLP